MRRGNATKNADSRSVVIKTLARNKYIANITSKTIQRQKDKVLIVNNSKSDKHKTNKKVKMFKREEVEEALKEQNEAFEEEKVLRERVTRRLKVLQTMKEETARIRMRNSVMRRILEETEGIEEKYIPEGKEGHEEYLNKVDEIGYSGNPVMHMNDRFDMKSPNEEFEVNVHTTVTAKNLKLNIDEQIKTFSVVYSFMPEGINRSVYSGWAEQMEVIPVGAKMDAS